MNICDLAVLISLYVRMHSISFVLIQFVGYCVTQQGSVWAFVRRLHIQILMVPQLILASSVRRNIIEQTWSLSADICLKVAMFFFLMNLVGCLSQNNKKY